MTLLQIAEPGFLTAPYEHQLAVGIDLGTTNSLVATVRHGTAVVLPDENGRYLLPSVVRYLENESAQVGYEAQTAQNHDPSNTILSVKRFMGRGRTDVSYPKDLPYHFIDTSGMVQLQTRAGVKSPVEISADILRVLKQRAELALAGKLTGAVITVPAYFDDAQRQATKDAAKLAGLNVLRLLNEPTAAAIAYGLNNDVEGTYAIYDLGGGTFDISILKMTKGIFEVIASSGDSSIGGDDFDYSIYCWILQQVNLPVNPQDSRQLLTHARRAKETLSEQDSTRINVLLADGQAIELELDQPTFHQLTNALVRRTLLLVRKALRDARLCVNDISGVVMVGGATRMPHVQQAVADFFGRSPLTNLDPDKVVALGAAMQADVLAGNKQGEEWLLLDVIPLSLGIETIGGLTEKIIPRNSTLPIARSQVFTTFQDGQTAMKIHVLQGERELVADCRSLGDFVLRGIPPLAAGAARVRITFQVDADGLLSVTACEETTATEASIEVKPSYGLNDQDIARMLAESAGHAKDDINARQLRETIVDAERLVNIIERALLQDSDLLSNDDRRAIDTAIAAVTAAIATMVTSTIKEATRQLNHATEDFAAKRMDRHIQQALMGRRVTEL